MSMYTQIFTNVGLTKLANAIQNNERILLSKVCIGDANGNEFTPDPSQTSLINQVYEVDITRLTFNSEKQQIAIKAIIPPKIGNFTIREVGMKDEYGDFITVGRFPDKIITTSDTVNGSITLNILLTITNRENVFITISNQEIPVVLKTTERLLISENKSKLPTMVIGDLIFNKALIFNNITDNIIVGEVTVSTDGDYVLFDENDFLNDKYCIVSYMTEKG